MLSYEGGRTFPAAGSADLPLANDPKSSPLADVVASDIARSPEMVEEYRSDCIPCLRSAAVGT